MKQRLQLCKNLTATQCFQDIMREEGLRGLYRSYPLTVSMNIPFASCVVMCNENLKTIIRPWERQNSYLWYFLCAGIAGGTAGLLTNPLDVVKTRLQTQEVQPSCKRLRQMWENKKQIELKNEMKCCDQMGTHGGKGHHPDCHFSVRPSRYTDFRATVKYILKTEGPMAFTKGVFARMSINVPSTALSWGTYEFIKSFLIGKKDQD
jgi:solute carrier family 25 (mitochondrial iron transporter), member 28/37